MNKRHYEHTLPNIRGSLSNTYTAWNDVSCYVYHANLVIFFHIRKKDRVCLLGEGPYSPFCYIFHAIHLLAI